LESRKEQQSTENKYQKVTTSGLIRFDQHNICWGSGHCRTLLFWGGMLKRLIASLEDRTELPIEVEEIASLLVQLGFQDQIQFYGVAEDRAKIRGAFYQFTIRRGVYADPELVTLIAYNKNDTVEMQRLTCCKELERVASSLIQD
jgi:hypothetical protein